MTEPDLVALGQRIWRARHAAGLTQQDLATAAGMTRSSIANSEVGRQRLKLSALQRIAVACGTTVAALADEPEAARDEELRHEGRIQAARSLGLTPGSAGWLLAVRSPGGE